MMKLKQRRMTGGICLLLMLLSILGTGLFIPAKRAAADAPSEIRECVVMVVESVRYYGTKSYREISQGSGFFVGNSGENPMYLVTNHHVIENYLRLGEGKKAKLMDGSGNYYDKARIEVFFEEKDSVEAYPVAYNEKADVAILRIENATEKRKPLAVMEPNDDMVGSTVYAFGFPGIADGDHKDAVSQRGKSDVSVTQGLISRLLTQHGSGIREIQTDTQFWHGNSGGPLVTESGIAIGITANVWTDAVTDSQFERENYAVSMAEVIPLLKNNNIPYVSESMVGTGDDTGDDAVSSEDTAGSENLSGSEDSSYADSSVKAEEQSSGLSTTMIIIIVAVAVVVIAVIIVIVVLSSRKKQNSAGGSGGGSSVYMGNPVPMNGGNQMGNPAPVNMGNPSPGNPVNTGSMEFNLSVQGVSGLFAGRTYAQGRDGRIMFGRQPSCQVVFGGNDKNVSGNHCVLFKQDGGVMLMDLGSTNGTYLENGTRLQPNVAYALHAGERFYLVNKNYMFMIK